MQTRNTLLRTPGAAARPTPIARQLLDTQQTERTVNLTTNTTASISSLAGSIIKELKNQWGSKLLSETSSTEDQQTFFEKLKPKLELKYRDLESEEGKVNLILQVVQSFVPSDVTWAVIEELEMARHYTSTERLWSDIGSVCFNYSRDKMTSGAEKLFISLQFTGLHEATTFEHRLLRASWETKASITRFREKYLGSIRKYASTRSAWHWFDSLASKFFYSADNINHCFNSNSPNGMTREQAADIQLLLLDFRDIVRVTLQEAEKDNSDDTNVNVIASASGVQVKNPKLTRPCHRCQSTEHFVNKCPQPDMRTPEEKLKAKEKYEKWKAANPEKVAQQGTKRSAASKDKSELTAVMTSLNELLQVFKQRKTSQ
jgi:hypothetical protein